MKDKATATATVAGGRGGYNRKKCDMMIIITSIFEVLTWALMKIQVF
jgi:hypothetical protein